MALLDPLTWITDLTRAVYIGMYILFTMMPAGVFGFMIAFILGPRAFGNSRLSVVGVGILLTLALWTIASYVVWGVLPWEFMKTVPYPNQTGGVVLE